jgi:5'-3' exonuclease
MDVILIDGNNYAWRHGWTRRSLRASNGFPTGVIYGVLAGMMRLHRYYPKAVMVFCWDGEHTSNSWRHKLAKTYKANRIKKSEGETPQEVKDVYMQIPALKLLLARMGFLQIEIPEFEADDLIGLVATKLSEIKVGKVYIYSSDKDFIQLMFKRVILIRDVDKKKNCKPLTEKQVEEDFGIIPSDWLKYRSLVGDTSDNIRKPIKGLGPKTALKMLAEGCDATKKKGYAGTKLKACWPDVRLNYKLTKIVRHYDDKRLPVKIRDRVKQLLDVIGKHPDKLGRTKEGRSHKSYRAVMELLAKYELNILLEARHKLWQLL